MLSLSQTTPPANSTEPVTIQKAKEVLGVTFDQHNARIGHLISVARRRIEGSTNRQFLNATWTLNLDNFPGSDTICLPKSPLSSVTSVKYYDTSSVQQTLSTDAYDTDTATIIPRIFLKYGQTWPSDVRGHTNDVEIIFVAGYGTATASVPETAQQAILMWVQWLYDPVRNFGPQCTEEDVMKTIHSLVATVEVPIVA